MAATAFSLLRLRANEEASEQRQDLTKPQTQKEARSSPGPLKRKHGDGTALLHSENALLSVIEGLSTGDTGKARPDSPEVSNKSLHSLQHHFSNGDVRCYGPLKLETTIQWPIQSAEKDRSTRPSRCPSNYLVRFGFMQGKATRQKNRSSVMGLEDAFIAKEFKLNLIKRLERRGLELGAGTLTAHLDWLSPERNCTV